MTSPASAATESPVAPATSDGSARFWDDAAGAVAQAVVGARGATAADRAWPSSPTATCCSRTCPGTGKTLLARAVARALGLETNRVQGTPDLLPVDVTGSSIFEGGALRFVPGPVFTNILLVDEINRATPRTQSALLEAMQERQVSVEGTTHPLPDPFIVLATQNPIEFEGTFALPQAQLDRFLVRARIGYPDEAGERAIARRYQAAAEPLDAIEPIIDGRALLALRDEVRRIRVADEVEALHRRPRPGDSRPHADVAARCQPAGDRRPVPRRAGRRRPGRPRLRAARRRQGGRRRRPRPPARRRPRPEPARRTADGALAADPRRRCRCRRFADGAEPPMTDPGGSAAVAPDPRSAPSSTFPIAIILGIVVLPLEIDPT